MLRSLGPMFYHITTSESWLGACAGEQYIPPAFAQEGFIHFSYMHQRRLTQQRYYRYCENLILLTIDPARLQGRLLIENGFPHYYSPLEKNAVVSVESLPTYRDLRVALIPEVFSKDAAGLADVLAKAEADLVVLPELPLNPWFPASPERREEDVAQGRAELMAGAARAAGKALLGGVIEETPGGRRNTAYLWDASGQPGLRYEKLHLPQEPGFWEANHYGPGHQPPQVYDGLGFPLGIQLCSDSQRPFGSFFLRQQGAGAILIPRATEAASYARWRRVFQALAQTTACYVLSVTRPAPELGVGLGGPSVAFGPDGELIEETEGPLVVNLEHAKVVAARAGYPGYLDVPADVYARGWLSVAPGAGP